jgi:hypothetical protein
MKESSFLDDCHQTPDQKIDERVTEESTRQTIFNLLVEEQQKQKDAGDNLNPNNVACTRVGEWRTPEPPSLGWGFF